MKKPVKTEPLADSRNALTMYLEALLNEVPHEDEEPFDELSAALANQPAPEKLVLNAAPVTSLINSAAPVVVLEAHGDDQDSDGTKRQEIPEWAVPRFQVLTFTLGGMQMAAVLNKLNGIIPIPERLTHLPGQSPWFLGLARNRNQNVQVIDLASAIAPQHRHSAEGTNCGAPPQYILLIGGGLWGIACHNITTVLTLETDQVLWRRSPHVPYILGTVVDKMHSVVCVDTLLERLKTGHLV